MIKRNLYNPIINDFFKGKIIIIYGARQVGKTTLIKEIQKEFQNDSVYLNCDEPNIAEMLTNKTSVELKLLTGNKKVVFIDEAQRVENIGLSLKLLVDKFPEKQIVATGSSSFDLANKIKEPLTGRTYEFLLPPISLREFKGEMPWPELQGHIESRMIFGMYPEIIEKMEDAERLLTSLSSNYLYKDILEWQQIRKPDLIVKLVKALALQVGNEVSYFELANMLSVSKETIASYIQLLEKVFVVFRLGPFSRNLRNELTKKQKIYFWDNGVRNSIINNFNPLSLRQDASVLWENFMISERLKFNSELGKNKNIFFWRTHSQQEIDLIEEYGGNLHCFEFKWGEKKKAKMPRLFAETYTNHTFDIISKNNFAHFTGLMDE